MAKAVNVAASELLAVASPGQRTHTRSVLIFLVCFLTSTFIILIHECNIPVTEVEVNRAKNATKSAVLTNLESRVKYISSIF